MQQSKHILILLLAVLLLQQCTPYSYVHPLPNNPAFTKGQQTKIGGTASIFSGHIQAGVAPINHVALVGGYGIGYAGQQSYTYGGQLFAPFAKVHTGQLFAACMFFYEGGKMDYQLQSTNYTNRAQNNYDIRAHYTGTNLQPSLYYANNTPKNGKITLGITYKYTNIQYTQFYYKESPVGSSTPNKFIDEKNYSFEGSTAWGFFMYEGENDRFYAISQIGAAFNGQTANKIQTNTKHYRFAYTPLLTATFGIRLWHK